MIVWVTRDKDGKGQAIAWRTDKPVLNNTSGMWEPEGRVAHVIEGLTHKDILNIIPNAQHGSCQQYELTLNPVKE